MQSHEGPIDKCTLYAIEKPEGDFCTSRPRSDRRAANRSTCLPNSTSPTIRTSPKCGHFLAAIKGSAPRVRHRDRAAIDKPEPAENALAQTGPQHRRTEEGNLPWRRGGSACFAASTESRGFARQANGMTEPSSMVSPLCCARWPAKDQGKGRRRRSRRVLFGHRLGLLREGDPVLSGDQTTTG